MTDIGPYLRAAWSVRTGGDMYKITDDNDWHYLYPPLFAILMTPLADPPHGEDRTGYLPYPLSVGIWYIVTMALGVIGIGILARTMEDPFRNLAAGRGRRFFTALVGIADRSPVGPSSGYRRCEMRGRWVCSSYFCFAAWLPLFSKAGGFAPACGFPAQFASKCFRSLYLPSFCGAVIGACFRMRRRTPGGSYSRARHLLGPERTVASYKSFYQEIVVAGSRVMPEAAAGRAYGNYEY